jgi:hypothetical protein
MLVEELQLAVTAQDWWQTHSKLGVVQRFTSFLRDVMVQEIREQIVIFIDEIDATLGLDFTDDFFAAIRSTYNQRATNSAYKRLTFVLLGVATPDDLMKDATRTPFNVGQSIALHEFTRANAQVLQDGLEDRFPGSGADLLDRVFHWTSGHPYLTQKICLELAAFPEIIDTPRQVDDLVAKLFFSGNTRSENNLKSVRRYIEQRPYTERQRLLQLYSQVYQENPIADDQRSLLQNRLKLIGLICTQDNKLIVRNRIYRQVFNQSWIKQSTPGTWDRLSTWQKITVSAVSVSVIVLIGLFLLAAWQTAQKDHYQREIHAELVQTSSDLGTRINSLYGLCKLEHQQIEQQLFYFFVAWFEPRDASRSEYDAQDLFYNLEQDAQLALFNHWHTGSYGYKLNVLVDCLSSPDDRVELKAVPDQDVAEAMCCALQHTTSQQHQQFAAEFERRFGQRCQCGDHYGR